MNKVLIFTGAGFSVPLGLPITTQFSAIIDECPEPLKIYLSNYLGNGYYDIEKITSTLESFLNHKHFINSIIESKLKTDANFINVNSHLKDVRKQCKEFLFKIKSGMYDLLADFKKENAKQIYLNMIRQIKEKYDDVRISIFTTNYDLTFENTVYNYRDEIRSIGFSDIFFGFTPDLGTFAFNPQQEFKWENNILEYIKLHGSLDWQSDDNVVCTKSGTSTKPANPDHSPLLYPGFKGIPNSEPFISFHERLVARLSEATEVIVIGFAFRDPYLNQIFEFYLRTSKANLYCFNPSEISKLPDESYIKIFSQRFKKFKYIQKGISAGENPLDFSSLT